MTDDEIEKIRQLCLNVPPGPWEADIDDGILATGKFYTPNGVWETFGDSWSVEIAKFIAAAREAIPGLITEIERLKHKLNSGYYKECVICDGTGHLFVRGSRPVVDLSQNFVRIKSECDRYRAAIEKHKAALNHDGLVSDRDLWSVLNNSIDFDDIPDVF